jgi:quercetin dioxygenase-like cupin family protein
MKRGGARVAYGDPTLLASRRAPRGFKCVIELGEDCTSIIEKGAAGIGQLDAARLATKQLHVKFLFDRLDQLTEWRLLDAEPIRRSRDVVLLGDRDEISEMPEFHCHMLQHMNIAEAILWLSAPEQATHSILRWRQRRCPSCNCRGGYDVPRSFWVAGVIPALLSASFAALPSAAQELDITFATPDTLKWVSTPIAPTNRIAWVVGNGQTAGKVYVLFASYPPGGKAMPHTHPDERVVTVLSGTFYLGSGPTFDESKAKELKAGSVIVIPRNAVHWGFARDSAVTIQEMGVGPTATTPWPKAATSTR